MRRFLVVSMVCLMALAIAVPSFALEVKWGGLFRARVLSQHDFTSYSATANDLAQIYGSKQINYTQHLNRFDQRLRMFIDFVSSENLKVVTKFETNTVWGSQAQAYNSNTGSGNVGADTGSLNIKNVYVDFKIPQTPLKATVGVQGINLVDSWIIDDDFSAALLHADLKPFTVIIGYVSGQNFQPQSEEENIDDLAAVVAFKEGPFNAALVGVWQDAHNTPASVFPTNNVYSDTPVAMNVPASPTAISNPFGWGNVVAERNQLFDLGFQLGYKIDFLSAYLNFVKNFGSVKLGPSPTALTTFDYKGWMIDAGVNYFCGPYTLNLGGFYTSGQKINQETFRGANPVLVPDSDLNWFTYPLATSKYFSEIMGGGILDNVAPNGGYWRGYPFPTNIWTVTLGGAWQVLPQTKLALSWWYFGTSEKVPARYDAIARNWKFDNYLGNEIDLNITQNIVDKLNLDLVGAYMFTGDAYRAKTYNVNYNKDDSVYELGARLQWTW